MTHSNRTAAALLAGLASTAALTAVVAGPLTTSADAAPAGARHTVSVANTVHRADIRALGWSTRGAKVTAYEDLGTSQSTIEPCQRTSLYAASGQSDVYTAQIYDRQQSFAGESVTQVDSFASARKLAGRLERQAEHCGDYRVLARHAATLPHGATRWYRLSDPGSGSRLEVAAFVQVGRRVALIGLTPQHRLSDARVEAFLDRAVDRLH